MLTFFAAPVMLSLRTMENDATMVQQAFNKFHFFGFIRELPGVIFLRLCFGFKKIILLTLDIEIMETEIMTKVFNSRRGLS